MTIPAPVIGILVVKAITPRFFSHCAGMAVPRECVTPRILSYATELHQPNTLGTSHAQLRGFSGLTRNHLLLAT